MASLDALNLEQPRAPKRVDDAPEAPRLRPDAATRGRQKKLVKRNRQAPKHDYEGSDVADRNAEDDFTEFARRKQQSTRLEVRVSRPDDDDDDAAAPAATRAWGGGRRPRKSQSCQPNLPSPAPDFGKKIVVVDDDVWFPARMRGPRRRRGDGSSCRAFETADALCRAFGCPRTRRVEAAAPPRRQRDRAFGPRERAASPPRRRRGDDRSRVRTRTSEASPTGRPRRGAGLRLRPRTLPVLSELHADRRRGACAERI